MKKKLLLMVFLGTLNLGFSQPAPPHPGVGENAGAPIPASLFILSVFSAVLLYKGSLNKPNF